MMRLPLMQGLALMALTCCMKVRCITTTCYPVAQVAWSMPWRSAPTAQCWHVG